MAASAITTQPAHRETGLRPVHLRRDLGEIANLIEFCFAPTLDSSGRAAIQEMRLLSRSGPLLWALTRVDRAGPSLLKGFVWLEAGRLVGNVSISPAGYGGGWVIANVAVHPDFRRHGIARHLMRAALEWAQARGRFATLQVEADNHAARALYDTLGFRAQRTFTRWHRASFYAQPQPGPIVPLRKLGSHDLPALLALARRARPNSAGGLGWLRPTRPESLRPSRLGGLSWLLSGKRLTLWRVRVPFNLRIQRFVHILGHRTLQGLFQTMVLIGLVEAVHVIAHIYAAARFLACPVHFDDSRREHYDTEEFLLRF